MTAPAPLWTMAEAEAACRGARASGGDWRAAGVSIDSRTVAPGDLFVALKGPNADGHNYLAEAFKRGCAAALVHRDDADESLGPLLRVSDTQGALEDLARAARARLGREVRVCAVTGSVGKTGAKAMLSAMLSAQAPTAATEGNLNNHWGLPLSLARVPADSRFAVLELGMNHAGELTPLSAMARPHAALITAVEAVHMEFFDSVEAVADAKAEIFSGLTEDGAAVINADSPHRKRLEKVAKAAGAARIVRFGEAAGAEARLVSWTPSETGSAVAAELHGAEVRYTLNAPGRHIVMNSLGALAAAAEMGAKIIPAARALADFTVPAGRGGRETLPWGAGAVTLIDESYNASPAAVRAALETLGAAESVRRIAVLGDMLELGPRAADYHAELAESCKAAGIDQIFACGPLMKHLFTAVPASMRGAHAETAAELAPAVTAALLPGDAVTVKGSRGVRTDVVADAVRAAAAVAPASGKRAVNGV
ncbi:MAG: UDP-N-acetylmuramoyl-tripeptide--D-alanyl-D-alanine ligase [Rhodospirillales bacterium]